MAQSHRAGIVSPHITSPHNFPGIGTASQPADQVIVSFRLATAFFFFQRLHIAAI